jgi:hypothetical protein
LMSFHDIDCPLGAASFDWVGVALILAPNT